MNNNIDELKYKHAVQTLGLIPPSELKSYRGLGEGFDELFKTVDRTINDSGVFIMLLAAAILIGYMSSK